MIGPLAIGRRNLPLVATVAVFVAGYALAALQFPAMLTPRVVGDLLTDNAYLGVLAVGMTFVLSLIHI